MSRHGPPRGPIFTFHHAHGFEPQKSPLKGSGSGVSGSATNRSGGARHVSAWSEESPLRVLLACDRLGYENARLHGAGRLMIQWTRALRDHGIDVTTIILREPGPLGQTVLDEGLPFRFLSRHPYDPRTLGDFVRVVRERGIQLLHLQAFGASTFGRLAALQTGLPAIVHVHADYRGEPKGYPSHVRMADALLARTTAKVFAISEPIADFAVEMQGFRPDQVEVLHNCVDLTEMMPPEVEQRHASRRALGLDDRTPVAVCVARFHPIKGVDVLVEAWATLVEDRPEAVLLLAGDGPMRAALEARASELRLHERVRFLGYQEDVRSVLWAADLAIVPSRSEGLSIAALEAMATGLPVVASRVGGLPEIVSHDRNGLLVEPEDPCALAKALLEAFGAVEGNDGSPSAAALEVAREHDLPYFVRKLEHTYRSLVTR